jgi:hypothetical protein
MGCVITRKTTCLYSLECVSPRIQAVSSTRSTAPVFFCSAHLPRVAAQRCRDSVQRNASMSRSTCNAKHQSFEAMHLDDIHIHACCWHILICQSVNPVIQKLRASSCRRQLHKMFEVLRQHQQTTMLETANIDMQGPYTVIPGPPAGWIPPIGASTNTWANIYKNKQRMDYCTDQVCMRVCMCAYMFMISLGAIYWKNNLEPFA